MQQRIAQLPQDAQSMALAGAKKCVEFQNLAYAEDYLDKLEHFAHQIPADRPDLLTELAKHLANAMVYDDLIRVADLKTRQQRLTRIEDEVQFDPADGSRSQNIFTRAPKRFVACCPPGLAAGLRTTQTASRGSTAASIKAAVFAAMAFGAFPVSICLAG